jgi:hypothetical protein
MEPGTGSVHNWLRMNARLVFLAILGLLVGLSRPARAADRRCPDCYPALDPRQIQAEIKSLKDHPATSPKDLQQRTTGIRRVDVISVPSNYATGIPASGRPQGSLQLDKVVVIDSSSR